MKEIGVIFMMKLDTFESMSFAMKNRCLCNKMSGDSSGQGFRAGGRFISRIIWYSISFLLPSFSLLIPLVRY